MHKKTATAAHHSSGVSTSVQQPDAASTPGRQDRNGKSPSEELVRLHAYQRWEAAGRPAGDGVRFWLEAEQEFLQPIRANEIKVP